MEQERNRQRAMEGIDGRLHPAVDGHSLVKVKGKRRKVKGEIHYGLTVEGTGIT